MHVTESRHRFLVSMSIGEMDLVRRLIDLAIEHHSGYGQYDPLAVAAQKARLDKAFADSLDGGDRRNLTKWSREDRGNPLRRVNTRRTEFNERSLPQAANALRARRAAESRGE